MAAGESPTNFDRVEVVCQYQRNRTPNESWHGGLILHVFNVMAFVMPWSVSWQASATDTARVPGPD